jgi:hypothetical protein
LVYFEEGKFTTTDKRSIFSSRKKHKTNRGRNEAEKDREDK